MGDMALYPYDTVYPLVDHPHERTHQHQNFWRYLSHKQPDPILYPNYPDVDIRDAVSEYLIEIEVPGVKDSSDITCKWTSMKSLVVSGNVTRPAWKSSSQHSAPLSEQRTVDKEDTKGTRNSQGDFKPLDQHEPNLLVAERRIGAFRRNFYFPLDVEMEKLTAKLEAGLLRLRVPKRGHTLPRNDGKINIEVQD